MRAIVASISRWDILWLTAIFGLHSGHLGWLFGAVAGVSLYFYLYGAWRSGSALLIRMAVWSMLIFLAGPVLLSNVPFFQHHGAFRLTPPRADSWSNILGCMIGLLLYFRKTGQKPMAFVTLLSGAFGGLALTTAQFVKVLCYSPGNPKLTDNPRVSSSILISSMKSSFGHEFSWYSSVIFFWHSVCPIIFIANIR